MQKMFEKFVQFVLLVPLILPIVITSSTLFPWHFGKTMYFQIFVMVLAVVAVGCYWKYAPKQFTQHSVMLQWFDLGIVVLLLAMLISTIFSVNPEKSFFGSIARAQGTLTYLCFGVWYVLLRVYVRSEVLWKWSLRVVLWVAVAACITAFLQVPLQAYLGLPESLLYSNRLSGIIGNPAFLAGYLFIPFIIALFLGFKETVLAWRVHALVLALVIGSGLYSTQTRSVFVGFVAMLAVFLLFSLFMYKKQQLKIVGVGVVLLVLFAGLGTQADKLSSVRIVRFDNILNPSASESARFWAWGSAWDGFLKSPIAGWGSENFETVSNLFYDPRFYRIAASEATWDMPHSILFGVLVHHGVIGLFASLFAVFSVLYALYKHACEQETLGNRFAWTVLTSGLIGYIVHDLFLFETSNTLMLLVFVLAYGAWSIGSSGGATHVSVWFSKKIVPALHTYRTVALIIVLLAGSFVTVTSQQHIVHARHLSQAGKLADVHDVFGWGKEAQQVLTSKAPYQFEGLKFLVSDLTNLDNQVRLNKVVVSDVAQEFIAKFEEVNDSGVYEQYVPYFLWKGQLYTLLGEHVNEDYFNDAKIALEQAHTLSPHRQDVWYLLGKLALIQKDFERALQIHREILLSNASVSDAHWFYGLVLVASGNPDAGVTFLENAMHMKDRGRITTLKNVYYLGDLYASRGELEKMAAFYEFVLSEETLYDNPELTARLAAIYAELGETDKAVYTLEKAVLLDASLEQEAMQFLEQLKSKEDN